MASKGKNQLQLRDLSRERLDLLLLKFVSGWTAENGRRCKELDDTIRHAPTE